MGKEDIQEQRDPLKRANEAIPKNKEWQEINIKFKAKQCKSGICLSLNGEIYDDFDRGLRDLSTIIRIHLLKSFSK